ncbi:zinc ABC transporter ATP-binding protein AztA [Arthrobacter tumbae]|uniref:zinc ABC transporter ATP-binding protein AztA n=1 Tax=Arthrobacter tumbae TaxID=163874 RepID=UPI00195EB3E4|nr:zinc ABC transporter ATP-binding protein AztA [Arthrobacter tumbae]MBM7782191.1 zinc/manganese transport system ATP-binding protein [Arthrobacter tumbae]
MVIVSGVRYAYPGRQALGGLTLTFERGVHTVVTGTNGSGKSTLLALAAGVLRPQSGSVLLTTSSRPAFVIQHTRIPETLPSTVRQAVEMGRWPHRPWLLPLGPRDRRIARDAMERLGISDLADRQLTGLSGGQRQRALIAQGLAQEADILILDEPTAGLDTAAHQLIRVAVDEELQRGVTIIESSHSPEDIERAERVVTLEGGRVISDTGSMSRPAISATLTP